MTRFIAGLILIGVALGTMLASGGLKLGTENPRCVSQTTGFYWQPFYEFSWGRLYWPVFTEHCTARYDKQNEVIIQE